MDKMFIVARREYLERVRSKWFLIGTFFGPILLAVIMFLPAVLGSRTGASRDVSNVAIVDATGTDLGRRVADRLSGGPMGDTSMARVLPVEPAGLAAAESLATRQVMERELQGYFVLDSATLAGLSARYAGRNASSISDLDRLESAVRQSVLSHRLEAAGMDPDRVRAVTETRLDLSSEQITERGRGGSGTANIIFGMSVGFLLYFVIFLYGYNVLRGVQEEKQTRVAEVVLSSAPATSLLGGKVLGIGLVGLTQMLVWTGTAILITRLRQPILAALGVESLPFRLPSISAGAIVVLLLFFVLGYALYAAMFAAVGAMVNSDQEAQQAAQPVMFLLIGSILFLQVVMQNPNGGLASAVTRIPFFAPILMPIRMSLTEVGTLELTLVLAGIALTCVAMVWLAARIYRVGLLMYGKRPSMRELVRWVRHA
ncbi:MAG TPA: ABC transporter permease [Gemmatimonadales bacterium]